MNKNKNRQVIFWSVLGAFFLLLQLYVYSAWIMSDEFRATLPGSDPLPDRALIGIRIYEMLSVASLVFVIPWFFNGIRKAGKIDHFRLMMLGWLATWWTDPWLSFIRPMFTYNAYAFNRGCWCEFLPFWQSDNGSRIAEPLLIVGPAYFLSFAGTVWISLWAMNKTRGKWPEIGNAMLCLAAFAGVWFSMGLLDVFATRVIHMDAWPGAFHGFSVWGGSFYQFPVYEFVLFPSVFVVCAFVIFYADKSGDTIIERGIYSLGIQHQSLITLLRVLAFVGLCNVVNLAYTSAMALHSLYVDPWPENMPSWLSNEQCGTITGIPCEATAD